MARTKIKIRKFDISTFVGIFGGFAVIIMAMLWNGFDASFVNKPALLIVIGGTFMATLAAFSFRDVFFGLKYALVSFFSKLDTPTLVAEWIIRGSEISYTGGLLSLQKNYLQDIKGLPYLQKGLLNLADGMSISECQRVMEDEIRVGQERMENAASVWAKMAEISPAMGLIGTLVGLVQMLSNLSDPTMIGPSMAVALLTTFYGAIFAYLICLSLSTRIMREAQTTKQIELLCLEGIKAIEKRSNPRRVEILLNGLLAQDEQVRYWK